MDRRNFVKMGAMGMVGAMEAKEKPGSLHRNEQKEAPAGIPENSAGIYPRILFHCHCFPPNPERFPLDPDTGFFPGSVDHLCAFISRLGLDKATALSRSRCPRGDAPAVSTRAPTG